MNKELGLFGAYPDFGQWSEPTSEVGRDVFNLGIGLSSKRHPFCREQLKVVRLWQTSRPEKFDVVAVSAPKHSHKDEDFLTARTNFFHDDSVVANPMFAVRTNRPQPLSGKEDV